MRGVEQEIHQHLLEIVALPVHARPLGRELEPQRHSAQHTLCAQQVHYVAHRLVDVDRNGRGTARARVVEQTSHDPIDAKSLALEPDHSVERERIECDVAAQDVGVAVERTERIADLVRDARGESPDARELLGAHELRLLLEQALGHAIHAVGQLVELERIVRGDAASQVARGDRLSGSGGVAQRAHDEPVDLEGAERDDDHDVDGDEHADVHRAARRLDAIVEQHDRRHREEERGDGEDREVDEELRAER